MSISSCHNDCSASLQKKPKIYKRQLWQQQQQQQKEMSAISQSASTLTSASASASAPSLPAPASPIDQYVMSESLMQTWGFPLPITAIASTSVENVSVVLSVDLKEPIEGNGGDITGTDECCDDPSNAA
jgi:hypothetical protein